MNEHSAPNPNNSQSLPGQLNSDCQPSGIPPVGRPKRSAISGGVPPEILEAFVESFEPANDVENNLVSKLATLNWKIKKNLQHQKDLINAEIGRQQQKGPVVEESLRTALAVKSLLENGKLLDFLRRQESKFHSESEHALLTLFRIQRNRRRKGRVQPFTAKTKKAAAGKAAA